MYTITKGPSKLVAQRRTGPSQQQVESRLGELLKCRQPAPPTPAPPRAQPPGPWPLSSAPLSQGGPPSGGGAPEPRKASRPAGPRVPGGVARAAQDSRLPPPAGLGQLLTGSSPLYSPGPRLVFNRVNGRRPPATSPSLEGTQETYTLAHEENVRFVSEAWQQVEQQLGSGPAGASGPRPVQLRAH
ncbi:MAPK regulated corepressor interacting protein 2 isoform X2 [Mustela nigripes]|uniref:MAPK regulated corepressor interacting protein 2 isoform X2 n=1 Tax=Mustela putorius furo TaxID=9669 RepID=A0A8U0RSM6_MUSPF|nr:MAPK regulated corepressor interacting protein 2 isoform X2 [Mustela putorius furo]XP_059010066.1 MAPK regulated corepressor interacting protein 2 isoform X2 [Mustela lutreola]XP_059271799.1 MAPK regulated corepressor interacting protein 2 isoform X2 [Mustela nigripes]